jgi:hypothetical protein
MYVTIFLVITIGILAYALIRTHGLQGKVGALITKVEDEIGGLEQKAKAEVLTLVSDVKRYL